MKTFAAIAFAGVASATLMDPNDYEFMRYVTKYNKFYETVEEFTRRMEIFVETKLTIAMLNNRNSSYRAGLNQFSDWTNEEYESMLGLLADYDVSDNEKWTGAPNSTGIDWRTIGDTVTPVKDQGACGSCWAFSATETTESSWVIAGNDQVIMAPQELVDCAKGLFSNHGCNGGWYYYAWNWNKDNMTMRESDYPYTSGSTGDETPCAYDESKGVTLVADYGQVAEDTDSIKARIEQGPVSVAVAAGNDVFRNYTSGIVTEADGCPTRLDHAIQAVGWGSENGQDYYIVRNSWNTTWGDQGYIKIGTGSGKGVCGINQAVYWNSV